MDRAPAPATVQGNLDGGDAERTVIAAAAPPPAALAPGSRLDGYDVLRAVGHGGFGIVYLVRDPLLDCRFAIKEYMPASIASRGGDGRVSLKAERDREVFEIGLRSFVNEAQLLAGFDHPALVKVFRFWEANGTAYMLMPYYEGPTLKEILENDPRRIDEAWLRALLVPLTAALTVLHARHCYHRDIAPDNVKLRADTGEPVLLDFGAARRVIGDMKRDLTVIYKPGYAPLEQREESGLAQGPWTDVYALAAMLYRAIAGALPPSPLARLEADPYEPLGRRFHASYDAAFLAAIDRALAVRPTDRTPSIEQFRAELGLDQMPRVQGDSRPATNRPPLRSPLRRGLLVAAGLAVLAAAGAGWRRRHEAASPAAAAAPPAAAPSQSAPRAADATLPASASASAPASSQPWEGGAAAPFDAILAGSSPGFGVELVARHTRLRVDHDDLALSVRASRAGHVYVLLLDADGSVLLMFPQAAAPPLTISPGAALGLPHLRARKPIGPERFLAIVSSRPRDFAALARPAGIFRRLELDGGATPATAASFAGRPVCAAADDCDDEYGAATLDLEVVP